MLFGSLLKRKLQMRRMANLSILYGMFGRLVGKLPSSKKLLDNTIHRRVTPQVTMDSDFLEERQDSVLANESLVILIAAVIAFVGQIIPIFLGIRQEKTRETILRH